MSFILEPRFLFDASVGTTGNTQHEHHHPHHEDTSQGDGNGAATPAAADGNSGGGQTAAEPTTTTANHHGSRPGDDRGNATTNATIADTSPSAQATHVDTILFVDPRVADWQQLADSVSSSTKVIVIDPNKDGLAQVTRALSHFNDIKEVDFLTYGQSGQIELGSSPITDAVLNANATEVAGWSNSLAANAQIQFWGCDVGAGEAGQAFVNDLHAITGAGIAASTDATGTAALGANWTLERTAGAVTPSSPFSATAEAHYSSVLDEPVPTISLTDVPTSVAFGTSFSEIVSITNTASTQTGYAPFLEVFVQNTVGTAETLSLDSATYLGSAVTVTKVVLSTTVAGHTGVLGAIDPDDVNSSGTAQFVAAPSAGFQAGDFMYVVTLPTSTSLAAGAPPALVTLNFTSGGTGASSAATNIDVVGGFTKGDTALGTNGSIRGTGGTNNLGDPTNAGLQIQALAVLEGQPVPKVVLGDLPSTILLGDGFTETVSFSTDPSGPTGYGPFVELFVPQSTASGESITLNTSNVTYLGTALDASAITTVTLSTNIAGHVGVLGGIDPNDVDANGVAQFVAAPSNFHANDVMYSIKLPFGSYTVGEPAADLTLHFQTSGVGDLSTQSPSTAEIAAVGGFTYGDSATNAHGSIRGTAGNNNTGDPTGAGLLTKTPNIGLLTVTTTVSTNHGEDETATGSNYLNDYIVKLTPAPVTDGDGLSNLVFTLTLPDDVQWNGLPITFTGATGTLDASSTATTTTPGGTLVFKYANLASASATSSAVASTIDIKFYVPEKDSGGTVVLSETGSTVGAQRSVELNPIYTYTADVWHNTTTNADNTGNATVSGTGQAGDATFIAKSLAIQEHDWQTSDSSHTNSALLPDTDYTYTIDFQVSDYYSLADLVINSLLSDGLTLDTSIGPTLTLNGNNGVSVNGGAAIAFESIAGTSDTVNGQAVAKSGTGVDGEWQYLRNDSNTSGTALDGGALTPGQTSLQFNVAQLLANNGFASLLTGSTGTATSGTITFHVKSLDMYTQSANTLTGNTDSVREGDQVKSDVVGTSGGTVTSLTTGQSSTVFDTSGLTNTEAQGGMTLVIAEVNGSAYTGQSIEAGDKVTYELTYNLTTGDYGDLDLAAYLALPVFSEPGALTQVTDGSNAANTFQVLSNPAGVGATIPPPTFNSTANSVDFHFGTYDSTSNTAHQTVKVDFTVVASNSPFVDGLKLTTQGQSSYTNAETTTSNAAAIQAVTIAEPQLVIKTGVVSDVNDGATAEKTGSSFTPDTGAGSATPTSAFDIAGTTVGVDTGDKTTGVFQGDTPQTTIGNLENQNLTGADGGDVARIVEAVQNTGAGNAYDVTVSGTLPTGYTAGTNTSDNVKSVTITRGDGVQLAVLTSATDLANFFTATTGYKISNASGDTNTGLVLYGAGDSQHRDVLYITYDMAVAATAIPASTLTMAGSVVNFSSASGGPGFVTGGGGTSPSAPNTTSTDLSDKATIGISSAQLTKALTAGGATLPTGLASTNPTEVTIGETLTYTLTLQLPEGQTPGTSFVDTLSSFLDASTVQLVSVSGSANVTVEHATPTASVSGQKVTWDVGNITNGNTDAAGTVTLTYTVQVKDVSGGGGDSKGSTIPNSASVSYNSTQTISSNTVNATVAEPTLTETITVKDHTTGNVVTNPYSGEVLDYTIKYTNATGSNVSAAEDFSSTLNIPSDPTTGQLTNVSAITAAGTNAAVAGTTISASEIAAGASVSYSFTATVDDNLAQGTAITVSTTSGAYSSMPGTVTGERGYTVNKTGTINVTSFSPALVIVDQSNGTSATDGKSEPTDIANTGNPTSSADAVIGEIVRMEAYIQVPFGQNAVDLNVSLPTGFTYLNDGSTTFAFYSNTAGSLTTSDTTHFTGSSYQLSDGTTAFPTSFDPTKIGNPTTQLDAGAISTSAQTGGNVVSFNFGTLTDNSATDGASGRANYVVVQFNALVSNATSGGVSVNTNGSSLVSGVAVNAPTTYGGSSNTTVTVVEPHVTIAKTITSITAIDATHYDVVWQDVVSNTGPTTAFDVSLSDQISTTNEGAITSVGTPTGDATHLSSIAGDVGTQTFAATMDLAAGKSEIFTYHTTVTGAVPNNPATVTYQSLNENTSTVNATGSTAFTNDGTNVKFYGSTYGTTTSTTVDLHPGNATSGSTNGERDGSTTTNAPDNYYAAATLGIGQVTGTLWDDVGDPLAEAGDSATSVTDHALSTLLSGYNLTADWTGGSTETATTDFNGNYSFLLPSAVSVTITAPTSGSSSTETLVYSTNGSTFSRNPSGTGSIELALTANTLSVTPTDNATITGYNFAYRKADTAPTITANADTTKASWGNTAAADTYTMGGSAITLAVAGSTVGDTQLDQLVNNSLGDYSGTILTVVRNGGANANDVFGGSGLLTLTGGTTTSGVVSYNGTQIGTYDNSSTAGQLKITLGSATNATTVQNILNNLAYSNSGSNTQLAAGILLNATLTDHDILTGGAAGNAYQGLGGVATSAIAQIMLNLAPAAASGTFTEPNNTTGSGSTETVAGRAVAIAPSVTVTGTTYQTVVLQITNDVSPEDVLAFTNTAAIHGSYDSSTGTLTLTNQGSAVASDWQAALRSVTYSDSSDTPNSTTRSIKLTATTAGGDVVTDAPFSSVTVVPVNDSPVLGSGILTNINETSTTGLNSAPPSDGSGGFLVSSLANATTDPDKAGDHDGGTAGVSGIAVTLADTTYGTWYYQLASDVTHTWHTITLSGTNALHLEGGDKLFFEPTSTASTSNSVVLQYRAWDQFDGAGKEGTITDIGSTLGVAATDNDNGTAYSSNVNSINYTAPLSLDTKAVTYNEPNNADGTTNVSAEQSLLGSITASTAFSTVTVTLSNYQSADDVIAFTANSGTMGDIQLGSNTSGVITLTSAGGATASQWQTALRAIEYYNTNDTPTTVETTARNVSISATYSAGTTTTYTNAAQSTVAVVPANDSPVLAASLTSSITENGTSGLNVVPTGSTDGFLVSQFAKNGTGGNITDGDLAGDANGSTTGVAGIVVTQADTTQGNWYYELASQGSSTWVEFASSSMTAISSSNALHLQASDRIAFVPTATTSASISPALSFRAWDQYSPTTPIADGALTDIGTTGFGTGTNTAASAYSSAVDTVQLVVPLSLDTKAVTYNEPNNADGTTNVSAEQSLLGNITASTAFSTVTATLSNYQSADDVIAFTANSGTMGDIQLGSNTGGVITLTSAGGATASQWQTALRAIEYYNTNNTPTTVETAARNVSISATYNAGGTTTYTNTTQSTVAVVPANDSPVLAASLTSSITENGTSGLNVVPTGSTDGFLVSQFAKNGTGGNITDTDLAGDANGSTAGVAGIVVTQADTTQGNWYYELASQGSSTWVEFASSSMTAISSANALHLQASDRIAFVPTATTSASISPALSFRAWDQFTPSGHTAIADGALTDIGTTGFGTGTNTDASAYSSAVDTVQLVVPLSLDTKAVTYNEPNNADGTTNVSAEQSLLGNITASTAFSTVTATLSGYVSADDVIAFTANSGTMGDIQLGSNTGGVITLTSAGGATASQWQTALRAIEYYNTNNTPTTVETAARNVSISATYNAGGTNTYTNTAQSTVTVTANDDSPVLGTSPIKTSLTQDENQTLNTLPGADTTNAAVTIGSLLANSTNITDADLANDSNGSTVGTQGVVITSADTSVGNWYYQATGSSTWTEFASSGMTAISASNAIRLLSTDKIYFEQTTQNFAGTISSALTFRAWDQSDTASPAAGDGTFVNLTGANFGTGTGNALGEAFSLQQDHIDLTLTETVTLTPKLVIVDESNGTEATDSSNSATLTPSQTNPVSSTDAVVGEIVRMRTYAEIPGGTNVVKINEALDPGLEFLNDGSATIELVSPGSNLTSSTIDPTASNGAIQVSDASGFVLSSANPTGGQTQLQAHTTTGTNSVSFDLGTVSNANFSSTTPNYVIIEFNVLVKNVAGNTAGTSHDTTATITGTNASGSATDTIRIVEPNVSITKTITSIDQTTGVVTWQDVVTNNGTTTAYNVHLTDQNDAAAGDVFGLTETGTGTNLTVLSGGTDNVTGLVEGKLDLGAGKSETFTYKTTVTGSVPDATATEHYQSLNENTPTSGTGFVNNGSTVTFYGSTYGTTTSSTLDTSPGHATTGNGEGERDGTGTTNTDGGVNSYHGSAQIGIGMISGQAWNSVDEPLDTADLGPTGPGDTAFPGVSITPTWNGQTTTFSTSTDTTGNYSLLVPDNVPVTLSTPATTGGQMLVYDTSNAATFNSNLSGLTGGQTGITVTATPGTTITDINFAFKPIPAVTPTTPDTPYLDPINQSPQIWGTLFGGEVRFFQGGLEPDWLVGSDVFRVLEAGIPGTASVSADVFFGSAPKQDLSYEAKGIGGGPIPNWLFFDPNLLRFSGTPPADMEGSVDVKVIATDRKGREATAEVHIVVLKEPADLLALLHPARPPSQDAVQPTGAPNGQGNGPRQPASTDTPAVVPLLRTPAPPANDGAPPAAAPAPSETPSGAPTNDNAPPPSPPQTQGALERGLGLPAVAERSVQGFGLSRQLREQSVAGRLAKSRSLLNALASERRAAL